MAVATMAILMTLSVVAEVAAQARFSPQVQRKLDVLKAEPSIQETQQAALSFFRIDPDTVSSMRRRAAIKAILPNLSVKGRINSSTIDLNKKDILISRDEAAIVDLGTGSVQEVEVAGSWDLSRLVFNSEVLDVSSLVVLQESILKEVTRIYYTRRRLQVALILDPPSDPATLISKEMRIEELTATLDAVTGGTFMKPTKDKKRR
jgi:hypothetical protein